MDPIPLPTTITTSAQICVKKFNLPLQIVLAIIQVESEGDCHAWRPESGYRYYWNVEKKAPFRAPTMSQLASESAPPDFPSHKGSKNAEWWGQAASWGPMQVMGASARELGFDQHFPALCDTYLGIEYGCRRLAALRDRFLASDGWRGVVAAYNAGTPRRAGRPLPKNPFVNQAYVDKAEQYGAFKGDL